MSVWIGQSTVERFTQEQEVVGEASSELHFAEYVRVGGAMFQAAKTID